MVPRAPHPRGDALRRPHPFGAGGGIAEVDETFIGHDQTIKPKGEKKSRGYAHKHKVLSLIHRETGRQRSMVAESLKAKDLT